MANTGWVSALTVTTEAVRDTTVLRTHGVLDEVSYLRLRDKIIHAALAEPRAVVVDVTELSVPAESAWSVFTSARWHVSRWPRIPIALVCKDTAGHGDVARAADPRHLSVYPTIESAIEALPHADNRSRHRARAELPATNASLHHARELIAGWLTAWSLIDLIAVTKIVVTAFVENVLQHTDSRPCVRLEADGDSVIVAVEDASHTPATITERTVRSYVPPSGLGIVSVLCRMWGNAPTPSGKTVWAVLGPENRL
jgi:hypothetical protein